MFFYAVRTAQSVHDCKRELLRKEALRGEGYLAEDDRTDGGPHPITQVLLPEAIAQQGQPVPISSVQLRQRLARVKAALQRRTHEQVEREMKCIEMFIAFCERVERRTRAPVGIIAEEEFGVVTR